MNNQETINRIGQVADALRILNGLQYELMKKEAELNALIEIRNSTGNGCLDTDIAIAEASLKWVIGLWNDQLQKSSV